MMFHMLKSMMGIFLRARSTFIACSGEPMLSTFVPGSGIRVNLQTVILSLTRVTEWMGGCNAVFYRDNSALCDTQ